MKSQIYCDQLVLLMASYGYAGRFEEHASFQTSCTIEKCLSKKCSLTVFKESPEPEYIYWKNFSVWRFQISLFSQYIGSSFITLWTYLCSCQRKILLGSLSVRLEVMFLKFTKLLVQLCHLYKLKLFVCRLSVQTRVFIWLF